MSEYVCGYVIEFADAGQPEEQVLGRGTLEECERIGELIPAIAYSGRRPNPKARFVIALDPGPIVRCVASSEVKP